MKIFILFLAMIRFGDFIAHAETALEVASVFAAIEQGLEKGAKSGDYSEVTNTLEGLSNKEKDELSKNSDVYKLFVDFLTNQFARTDPAENAQLLNQLIKLYPMNYEFAVSYLKSVIETGYYEWAVAVFDHISKTFNISGDIEEKKLKAASNALLGLASLQIGKVGTAKPYFEKAISIEPEWAGGYFFMSAVFIRQNKPDIAIDYLYKVIELNPSHIGAKKMIDAIKG